MSQLNSPNDPVAGGLGFQLSDYLAVARGRKWWIIVSATALFVATTVAVFRIPDSYRSETVILVEPQKVPDSYVVSTVTTGVADRLGTIRQVANSPTRLKPLMDKLNLYPEVRLKDPDAAIARMQRNINIDVADSGAQKTSAFKIAFYSPSPEVAAQVANSLADMIIQDNLHTRDLAFSGTEEFLDHELQDTKKQLEDKEAEVQKIKTQYVLDLPESQQFHLETLNTLRNQQNTSQDRVNQDKQEIVYLQSSASNAAAPPTVDLDSLDQSGDAGNSLEQTTIQRDQSRLAALQARYGPQYPDVRKLQSEIAELKSKAALDTQEQVQPDPTKLAERALHQNPVIEAQITKLQQEIEDQTKLQAQLQPQIDFHVSKLQNEPVFEQQIAGLMRDYDTLRAHYNNLLDKKLSADMALQLEARQQGERFVILDPAPIPRRPSGPNRPLFSLAGLLGGLVGGFALAMMAEMTDVSVRSEREAAQILDAPVLAGIPRIFTPTERLRRYAFGAVTIGLTAVVGAVAGIFFPYALRLLS